jgi:hypothetical protein
MLKAAPNDTPAREVYRGSLPTYLTSPTVLVVTPYSPHPILRNAGPLVSPINGTVLQSTDIPATERSTDWEYDAVDAFFLPLRPLQSVIRPGPGLRLALIRR